MEYLLLEDGTLVPFTEAQHHDDVLRLLAKPDAVAYYWNNPEFGWSIFKIGTSGKAIIAHNIKDLPEIVKLAAMLE